MKKNKQIDIRRALALAGTFSFLCSCARACLLPFLTLYFRQLGLTPAQTGIVMGTKHLITLVWSPLASMAAKHYNKRRAVITGSLTCSAAVALLVLLLPHTDVQLRGNICNVSDESQIQSQGGDVFITRVRLTTLSARTSVNMNTSAVSASGSSSGPTSRATSGPTSRATSGPTSRATFGTTSRATSRTTSGATSGAASGPTSGPTSRATSRPRTGSASVADSPAEDLSASAPVETRSSPVEPPPHLSSENTSVVVNDSSGEANISNSSSVRKRRSDEGSGEEAKSSVYFEFLGSLKAMDPQQQLFFMILIAVSVLELAWSPLEWTSDDGLYEYLDFADASDRYSSSGAWSLLGAACGVGAAGVLVSQLSCLIVGQTHRSAVHFYCYACVVALALPVGIYLPLYLNKKRDRANGLLKAAQLVRASPRALLCAVTIVLAGVVGSTVDNFLLWQMQDHESNELHMGLSLALAVLSQAAFPLFAGRVSKVLSPGKILAMGVLTLSLQCVYYSFLWGPWAALPAQVLSCFSTGALWWAVRTQCEDLATPGAERSVRRIFGTFSLQVGGGAGSYAGGFVVQRFGLAWLFRGAAAVLLVWSICLPLMQWRAPRQRRINYSRLLAADASEASDSDSEQDWLDKAMEDDRGNNNNNGRRIDH